MKKVLFSLALMLLAVGSAFGAPRFKELNNFHGKTTIKIEIPASDRDADGGLSLGDVKLHNNGEMLAAKKVNAKWGEKAGRKPLQKPLRKELRKEWRKHHRHIRIQETHPLCRLHPIVHHERHPRHYQSPALHGQPLTRPSRKPD